MERYALGAAWALTGGRAPGVPPLARMTLAHLLNPSHDLPDPAAAREAPEGLCGIVPDLSVPTLLDAYRIGLYPFAHLGPAKWWSPAERCVLSFTDMHIAKRLRRQLHQERVT